MPGGGGGGSSGRRESREARQLYKTLSDISRSAWGDWKTYGRPQMEALSREVNEANVPGRMAQAQGLAAADVGRSYDQAEGSLRRSLGRYGLGGRFASGMRSLVLGRAADTAGARTLAGVGVLDRIRNTRMGIAGLAQGQGRTAVSGLGAAAGGMANMGASAARNRSSMWNSIGQIGGMIGSALILSSDRRIKHDIVAIDELAEGIKVYEFSFKGSSERYTGLIAQEVADVMPHHVYLMEHGYLGIDYAGVVEELAR